jgi:hypothetical protein
MSACVILASRSRLQSRTHICPSAARTAGRPAFSRTTWLSNSPSTHSILTTGRRAPATSIPSGRKENPTTNGSFACSSASLTRAYRCASPTTGRVKHFTAQSRPSVPRSW